MPQALRHNVAVTFESETVTAKTVFKYCYQLRWVGPEKGVIHLATAAIINAFWDLWAKMEKKPVWKLLVDMSPEQIVSMIDFRSIHKLLPHMDGFYDVSAPGFELMTSWPQNHQTSPWLFSSSPIYCCLLPKAKDIGITCVVAILVCTRIV